MSKAKKKNTGCINCVHYKGGMEPVMWLGNSVTKYDFIEVCNNKSLTKSNKTEIDPVHGEREIVLYVTPQNSNQHLTCKGFTPIPPIDWKEKHNEINSLYEKETRFNKEQKEKYSNLVLFNWIAGVTICLAVIGAVIGGLSRGAI